MTGELPPPPVPADADLTHFDDMPLEVRRLRDSGIAGTSDAEAFRCGVLGWCAAWHQIPAGSLPADDADLCRLVGLGRDLKTWKRIKASAMRGWRQFADGRLYHPVITEKVIERLNGHLLNRWGKECDLIRKQNKQRGEKGESQLTFPPKPEKIPYDWPREVAANSSGLSVGIPPEKALKGKERKGKESPTVSAAASSGGDTARAQGEPIPAERPADDLKPPAHIDRRCDQALAVWQEIAKAEGWPEVMFLNGERRVKLQVILDMCGGVEGWKAALETARDAEFLHGQDGQTHGWFDFDWLLNQQKFTRLMEGRYAERHRTDKPDERSNANALAGIAEAGSR